MKFYDCTTAPSPRRVRIFMAEKGIEVPTHQVDLRAAEQFSPEFRRHNPHCTVPALELDDGTSIHEATAVCRYFEAAYPDPPLMGVGPADQAAVAMWDHHMEQDGYLAVAEAFRNQASGFKGRALPGKHPIEQIPALVERGRERYRAFLEDLEERLKQSEFIAGPGFSVADITALVTVDFAARAIKIEVPEDYTSLRRWHEAVSARESAQA